MGKGLSLVASGNYKLAQRNKTEVKNEVTYYDWIGTVNGSKNGPGSLNESVEKWENVTLGGFANYERTFATVLPNWTNHSVGRISILFPDSGDSHVRTS